jgi:hypothetical protein
VKLLDENADKVYSPEDVARALSADARNVRSALARLSEESDGRLRKLGRGEYASRHHVSAEEPTLISSVAEEPER